MIDGVEAVLQPGCSGAAGFLPRRRRATTNSIFNLSVRSSVVWRGAGMARSRISMSLNASPARRAASLAGYRFAPMNEPNLVEPARLRVPEHYPRFTDLEAKASFRVQLRSALASAWASALPPATINGLLAAFDDLAADLRTSGAVILADLIAPNDFEALVRTYDDAMADWASSSILHSYLNLRPHLLSLQASAGDGLLHPLLLALVSDAMGGPICLVDARAKDTGPMEARAQDNMLHIDNTPFNDEYKLLYLWKKGEPSGPVGQNFTYLPGTHWAARECLISGDGEAYSTENASIFVDRASLDRLVELQKRLNRSDMASVVEVRDEGRPLTVAFAAGSLVHHRYRTGAGGERSCMILAFHPSRGSPNPFFAPAPAGADLVARVLGGPGGAMAPEAEFLAALSAAGPKIAEALAQLGKAFGVAALPPEPLQMNDDQFSRWFASVTAAPDIEQIKQRSRRLTNAEPVDIDDFLNVLCLDAMRYDKHGPLDLILYADSREEVRKWARNRIREMSITDLTARLADWRGAIRQPDLDDLLTTTAMIEGFANLLGRLKEGATEGWKVRSIVRLIDDLTESLARAYSLQNLLSTSLFLFWSVDELILAGGVDRIVGRPWGGKLLRHYAALALLQETSAEIAA